MTKILLDPSYLIEHGKIICSINAEESLDKKALTQKIQLNPKRSLVVILDNNEFREITSSADVQTLINTKRRLEFFSIPKLNFNYVPSSH